MYHANVNVEIMEENLVQINGGITIDTDVSIRNIMYVKKFILEILVHVDNSVITCDEIKDKTAPRSFKEKKQTVAQSFYILLGLFLITLAFLRARK